MPLLRLRSLVIGALAAAIALGCGDGPTATPRPPVASAAQGDAQSAAAGEAVAVPPAVRVSLAQGGAISGATVRFAITSGGGTLVAPDQLSNASGIAAVGGWTLGTALGENALTATVTVPGATPLSVVFRATAVPGAPARVAFVSQPSSVSADSALPVVRVELRDAHGHRTTSAADVSLQARGASGEVPLSGGGATAAVDGLATFVAPRLTRAGTGYRLVATAAFGSDTSITFDVRAGRAATLVAASAATQDGSVGTPVAERPAVSVSDAHGNPAVGVRVDFTIVTGGGTTQGATATTDAVGRAAVGGWTLGPIAGEQRLRAAVDGLPAISFVTTAAAGAPAALVFVTQPSDAVAGLAIAPALDVRVLDAFGNRVTAGSVPVTVALEPPAILGGTTAAATSGGTASFTSLVATTAGAGFRLVATSAGLAGASSDPFAVRAAGAASLERVAGDGQVASAGSAVAVPPAVRVRDAFGNPVSGASVTFAASGNGTVVGGTAITDTLGVASVTRWTLATTSGPNGLTATVAGVPPVVLAATGVAGPAVSVAVLSGDGQTARAATAVATAPAVRVQDVFGNAVAGVAVTFAVASGGGSVVGATQTTDSGGVARVGGWTLGPVAGANTLTATAAGVSAAVTFAASATPNATIRGTVTASDLALLAPARAGRDVAADVVARAAPAAEYVADELLVTYRDARTSRAPIASTPRERADLAARLVREGLADRPARGDGRRRWRVLDVNPATLTARVKLADAAALGTVAAELRRDPRVARVGRNAVLRRTAARALPVISGDSAYVRQAWHYAMIEAPEAWAITTGSAAVTVAVIDDGAQFAHPDLASAFTSDGFDFVSPGTIPNCAGGASFDRAADGDGFDADPTAPRFYVMSAGGCTSGAITAIDGHGLHVAGTIASPGANGRGGAGVSWSARIRPIRVFGADGTATEMDVAKAILYAAGLPVDTGGGPVVRASRSAIVNMSFGGYADAPELRAAVAAAAGEGVLLVAAAGNDDTATPFYPAAYPEVLSVSAVGPDARRASYSNFGATVDIAAPGGDVADGGETFGVWSALWSYASNAPTYGAYNGTSMAAPHVAGVAALLLAREPGMGAAALRARLLDHARDAGAAGRDDEYGAGILSARASLTRGAQPVRRTFVRLFDSTGARVRETVADGGGAYTFGELPNGRYRVYAGQDEDGDGVVGAPGRRWGAFGGTSAPAEIVVTGAGEQIASFAAGVPRGAEPNDDAARAVALAVGGYVTDSLAGTDINDFFRVRIPSAGTYTFETAAIAGACGHALAANTVLELRDAAGAVVALNDDVDAGARRFCSRITQSLAAGTYHLVVRRQARMDAVSGGRYAVSSRDGR